MSKTEHESRDTASMHRMLSKRAIRNKNKKDDDNDDDEMMQFKAAAENKYFLELEIKKTTNLQSKLEDSLRTGQFLQRDNQTAQDEINRLINKIKFLEEYKNNMEAKTPSFNDDSKNANNLQVNRNTLLDGNVKLLEATPTMLKYDSILPANNQIKFVDEYVKRLEANISTLQNNSTKANNQKKLLQEYVKYIWGIYGGSANITNSANSSQNYSSAIAKDTNIDKPHVTSKHVYTMPTPPRGPVCFTLEDGKTKLCIINNKIPSCPNAIQVKVNSPVKVIILYNF